ncbi:uncharacterized protein LOC102450277 [Pelodiscus sinensis]|uniref:uncharacterized protein LOC102450277 n=1 Tax=Pelodiscus sinensis TaxID=13735 RepID=UPI003F6C355B
MHQSQMSDLEEGQLSEADPDMSPNTCSPLPSRDEPLSLGETSPPDDLKEFQDLFKHAAQSQEVQLTESQVKQHKLFKNLHPKQQRKIALPIDDATLEVAQDIWQTPTSIPPTNKKMDKKYFVSSKGLEFLFNHPQPNSLIVDAVRHKSKMSQFKNSLSDRDTKKLDYFGRKVYSSSTLLLRVAYYAALLSNHNFDNYSKLPELMQHLPDNKRSLLKAVVQEGFTACRTSLQIAADIANTAARVMATGIAMRRASWLLSAGAPKELQSKVEDLPFDCQKLFASTTDEVLHSGKDSRTTLRSLEMYTPPFKRRRYYPFQRRYDYFSYKQQQRRGSDQPRFRQRPQCKLQQQNRSSARPSQKQQV